MLALQQPVAIDLRSLVTAIRLVSEIERSGDLMVNVAKGARRIYGVQFDPRLRGLIERMSEEATRLFRLSIDAYVEGNASLASALDDMDDGLDLLHKDYIQAIFESHHAGIIDLQAAVQLALIGRYYERIGDHAVNIGARVEYMVTGWLPEHSGAARLVARRGRAEQQLAEQIDDLDLRAQAGRRPTPASARRPDEPTTGDGRLEARSAMPLESAVVLVPASRPGGRSGGARRRRPGRAGPAARGPSGAGSTELTDELARARRQADQDRDQAAEATDRLEPALDAIPQGVLITDASGRVVFRNQIAETFESARHSDALVEAAITELVAAALGGQAGRRTIELFGPPRRTLRHRHHPSSSGHDATSVDRSPAALGGPGWRWPSSTTSPSAVGWRPPAATSWPTSATSCAPPSARSGCWPTPWWPRTTRPWPPAWPSAS